MLSKSIAIIKIIKRFVPLDLEIIWAFPEKHEATTPANKHASQPGKQLQQWK
jgi:hypothetical protein